MKIDIPQGAYRGFVFDLDGTLIDSMPVHYRAWNEVVRAAGAPADVDEDYFYSLGGMPTPRVAELLGERCGVRLDAERVTRDKEAAYLKNLAGVRLVEPVAAFARKVAETHPVSIATGGGPDIARQALKATGLDGIFKIVVTPLDVPPGRGKPAPDVFLLAAERMGVRPETCLVFEDAEPGMRGALAAGMRVARVDSRGL
ncbi:MAG: HAD-IA family hydrolase [Opitutaceae bacterium]|jgi:beta-phosphoglucomutase-like phosphatase (HAD superfamily)|nr:HAD-IA family hydrolase [Opitutaceae bacterium]